MNVTEYTYLLNKPEAVNDKQISSLENVIEEFPYFQSARSIYLKGLYKQDSFKYNQELKNTAAHTNDRSVLFDFISHENFISLQKQLFEDKEAKILDITVVDSNTVTPFVQFKNTLENSILSSIRTANIDIQNDKEIVFNKREESEIEEKLEIGKPLYFSQSETHSFNEWLQISKYKPIERDENTQVFTVENQNLTSKLELIDKFIESNPKIPQINKEAALPVITIKTEDTSYLMTETLAKVYLEQKKYSKAIQAYEILILKYPEKSSFFADRISDIKVVQQNINS